ncbi:MAG: DNA-directed RNA polymerase subunit alpha [Harvfovirus sp.]|uniref:DNA-directed RNA polymerase n=1 Tax=Harvfovirus sp. TaxID=2487768 RepID=A0A3G5A0Y0_9VIRU|nr:MAG: DNA-directed RNA polymerase subunit alpha [Harvfovirus sp.]
MLLIHDRIENKFKTIKIGKLIDDLLNDPKTIKVKDSMENEMGDTSYLDVKAKQLYIQSVTEDGKVLWKLIEAITRHLPMNKDGTNDLLEVKTRSGRMVKATKAKSFLTRIDNKIVPIRGDELAVGTFIPIIMKSSNTKYDEYLDMTHYLPKDKFIYGTEIEKARKIKEESNKRGSRLWFKGINGKAFTVPHKRQDTLKWVLDGNTIQKYDIGCIYPRKGKAMISKIPELFKLDRIFGFYLGAYVAEGCLSETYVAISNNDENFRTKVIEFCDKYSIGYHIVRKPKEEVPMATEDAFEVRIHSTLLAKLSKEWCGKLAHNKKVPDFAYNAHMDFIVGFLDGYYSGDGSVSIKQTSINAGSVSKELIDGLSLLLTRLDIFTHMGKSSSVKENNLGTKNILPMYTISIRNKNIHKFSKLVKLVLQEKQNRLEKLEDYKFQRACGRYDVIPGNDISILESTCHRDDLIKIVTKKGDQLSDDEEKVIDKILASDVYYDEIISIQLVKPSNKHVYDFTIADTKTFALLNGILGNDSFHHTGIAAISTTTQGVPRIKELLSLTKNLKTPQMILYPTKQYMGSRDMANKIASYIKYTTLGHLRERLNVYYDPDPHRVGGFMEKDNVTKVFATQSSSKYSCQADVASLPWLMRIEFNRESLYEKEVTLLDIKSKFCSVWEKRHTDKSIKKEEKRVFEKITQIAILSNTDYDKVPIIHIRFDMTDFEMSTLNDFIDHVIDKFKLKGLPNISNISTINEEQVLTFDNEHNDIEKKKQYVIYTVGVNLYDIRYLNGIDFNKTICNDVVAMYETFGIEAARATLLREIIYAYERAGSGVNYHHVSVLIDLMTFNGYMTSVDRHGMNKSDVGPLSRASFEKTVDQLLNAAVFGEVDHMTGVSSRIMAGLVIKGGTGLCNITLDTDMVQNSEFTEDIGQKYVKTYNDVSKNSFINDVMNKSTEDVGMFVPTK